jgi:hypothetical protein
LPSINHDNIGRLLPSDLLGAVSLFAGKYESEE